MNTFKVTDKNDFNQYNYVEDINVNVIRYQRVPGSIGGNVDAPKISFSQRRALPGSLLLSKVLIKWNFNFRKINDPAALNNNVFAVSDRLLLKPYDVISNSTKSMVLTINSHAIEYNNPRYWSKYMGLMNVGVSNMNTYFSTTGGDFLQGTAINDNFGDSILFNDPGYTNSLLKAYKNFVADAANGNPTTTFSFLQPINLSLFNPYYDMREQLPRQSWYKKMSNLIPHINEFKLDILLDKPAANMLQAQYLRNDAGDAQQVFILNDGIESAELILQWIKPRNMIIPDIVRLPSWKVDHRQFQVNNGVVVNSGDSVSFKTDALDYHSVPTVILLFATNDKDSDNYVCRAIQQDSDGAAANSVRSPDINSGETNMIMDNTTITIDFNNSIVTTKFSREEIYNLTVKNSCRDYPFSFHAFVGGQSISNDDTNSFNASQFHMILRPEDLNIVKSTGKLQNDFLITIQTTLTAESGYEIGNDNADIRGNKTYNFHVVLFYDKYYYDLNVNGVVDVKYESMFN